MSERLKLETSNFAYRLATGGPHEKNAKLGQKGLMGSRDLLLEFWEPLHIKFGMQIGHLAT